MPLAKGSEFKSLFRATHVERANLYQLIAGSPSRNSIRFDSLKEFLAKHSFFLDNQKIVNILRTIDVKCEGEISERVWDYFMKILSAFSKAEFISSSSFDVNYQQEQPFRTKGSQASFNSHASLKLASCHHGSIPITENRSSPTANMFGITHRPPKANFERLRQYSSGHRTLADDALENVCSTNFRADESNHAPKDL